MANALSQLFMDIANAIRSKTGGTSKIVPANFPSEINSIIVGGGNSNKEWKFASGELTNTGGTLTITHGLGAVPDIIRVQVSYVLNDCPQAFLGSLQFSTAMMEAMDASGGTGGGMYCCNAPNINSILCGTPTGACDGDSASDMWGYVRNATDTTFQVGGGSVTPIEDGKTITWWAVSGITG